MSFRSRTLAVLAALTVSACATAPPATVATPEALATLQSPFEATGRLSVRRGTEGMATNFAWEHAGGRDRIDLSTPLGQTVAQLSGDATAVELKLPDHRTFTAPDWDSLTARALGTPIPVTGLSAWMRGLPHADATSSIERDAQGRPVVLRQDGWEVVYQYADDATRKPSRLVLRYPGMDPVEVRIAIDQWQ